MATWMSNKGAGNIILVSRSGKVEGKTAELVQNLEANGTHVRVLSCDASSTGQVDQLIKEDMKDLPPVRGIIHGAMVLHVSHTPQSCLSYSLTNRTGRPLREDDLRRLYGRR